MRNQYLHDIMCANVKSKRTNLKFSAWNWGNCPIKMRYFGSNNTEGVAESWVEVGVRFSNTQFLNKFQPNQPFTRSIFSFF